MTPYLENSSEIDFEHPAIRGLVDRRGWRSLPAEEGVKAAFEFVRDEIAHSYDAGDPRVTLRASECLEAGVGLCYSKSHLLAALLRALGIPTAIRYQRLRLPSGDYCLHAFNAVELDGRWLDLDARGNNDKVKTEFSRSSPCLAFRPDVEKSEFTYAESFAEPTITVCEAHRHATTVLTMVLPSTIS